MSVRVAVIDYRMGNLRSIANALRHVGGDVQMVTSGAELADASHVVLPGVGAFGASMRNLAEHGLVDAIHAHVAAGRPLLGICLGFQVLFARGTEHGDHAGLGLVPGTVRRFATTTLHVPHTGWNAVEPTRAHPLLEGLPSGEPMYFVHSFHPDGVADADALATTTYGERFVCAVARDAVAGTQFHPEKSGPAGLRLLANYLSWRP